MITEDMRSTTTKATDALATAKSIAELARHGVITYEEAKHRATPYLEIVNTKGREVSKKYGRRYSPIGFSKLAR